MPTTTSCWLRRALIASTLVTALVGGACSKTEEDSRGEAAAGERVAATVPAPTLADDVGAATFGARPSVGMVAVQDATPATELALYDGRTPVALGTSDDQGSLVFREVEPGEYRVATTTSPQQATDPVTVPTVEESLPEQSFYEGQELEHGYTYITTRDGTTLAASVYLPGPADKGPYPTVVEYSGYDPAKPGGNIAKENASKLAELGISEVQACAMLAFLCDTPSQPSSIIALALGYAVVAVNVRGTGCSGGAYDYFDQAQVLDGYDVIETVASQDWVKGGKVGMVGLSYPGISQLFVAQTQPPHLAAITPLSVMDDTVRGVLMPGGLPNEGFALSWAKEVLSKAKPLGQGWEKARIDAGDTTCAENQTLRSQNVEVTERAMAYTSYPKELGDWYKISDFVEDINVPVYLSGAFQDEQTGGRFGHLWGRFKSSPLVRFTLWNGAHGDGYAPMNLSEWKTFLDLYVADQVPSMPPTFNLLAPVLMKDVFDADLTVEPVRFTEYATAAEARKAYEAEAPVRLVLESGSENPAQPGAPGGSAEYRFDQWPPPDVEATPFYLGADGSMSADEPGSTDVQAVRYNFDATLAKKVTLPGDNVDDAFKALPAYNWEQEPAGSAAVFVSPPLPDDLTLAGPASADLWIRSSTPNADLGVTLSEVRPDGKEVFIQAGVLRGTMRAPGKEATDLWPAQSLYESDLEEMPVGEFTEARVEIFPFAHVIRKGSRVRLSVHTPGGDRPRWSYILTPGQEGATFDVGAFADAPSRLMLPATDSISDYPSALPPCPGLRGQPCRDYVEYANTPAP
jgi:predicted acyl esterase